MYNFPEAKLGSDFAKDKLAEFKGLIETGISFTVVSMPGVGVSYFLKYLAMQDMPIYFLHIDLYNLPSLSQHEFYRMFLTELGGKPGPKTDEQVFLETKIILKKLTSVNKKIVIIFSRFDALKKAFDANFLSNLQSLATIESGKIVLIFTSTKPLDEIVPQAIKGGNVPFYSRILYFKPYLKLDLKKLISLEHKIDAHPNLDELIKESGGHNQLLHIFLNSHKQQNLLLDKFVKLQLKDLLDYLNYSQKKDAQKIALGKTVEEVDEYLLGTGFVEQTKSGYQLFSPLLAEYIKTNLPVKLPVKESNLFKLLRKNIGQTVSKDEIFTEIWGENSEASNWALDALIYRLRKHPFMKANGYIIESQKKVGYTLIQT